MDRLANRRFRWTCGDEKHGFEIVPGGVEGKPGASTPAAGTRIVWMFDKKAKRKPRSMPGAQPVRKPKPRWWKPSTKAAAVSLCTAPLREPAKATACGRMRTTTDEPERQGTEKVTIHASLSGFQVSVSHSVHADSSLDV